MSDFNQLVQLAYVNLLSASIQIMISVFFLSLPFYFFSVMQCTLWCVCVWWHAANPANSLRLYVHIRNVPYMGNHGRHLKSTHEGHDQLCLPSKNHAELTCVKLVSCERKTNRTISRLVPSDVSPNQLGLNNFVNETNLDIFSNWKKWKHGFLWWTSLGPNENCSWAIFGKRNWRASLCWLTTLYTLHQHTTHNTASQATSNGERDWERT